MCSRYSRSRCWCFRTRRFRSGARGAGAGWLWPLLIWGGGLRSVPQRLKPVCGGGVYSTAEAVPYRSVVGERARTEEVADGLCERSPNLPQGLKPFVSGVAYGTAEAVPLRGSDFSSGLGGCARNPCLKVQTWGTRHPGFDSWSASGAKARSCLELFSGLKPTAPSA